MRKLCISLAFFGFCVDVMLAQLFFAYQYPFNQPSSNSMSSAATGGVQTYYSPGVYQSATSQQTGTQAQSSSPAPAPASTPAPVQPTLATAVASTAASTAAVTVVSTGFLTSNAGAGPNTGASTTVGPLTSTHKSNLRLNLTMIEPSGATLEACAQLPPEIRDQNGCPVELPVDFSIDALDGDVMTNGLFANGDLQANLEIFEGDMRVRKGNATTLMRSHIRTAAVDPTRKWPNSIVPFVIDSAFVSNGVLAQVKVAMCNYYARTCIRFKARTNEPDFIKITSRETQGCYSFIGRQGGKQIVNLEIYSENNCLSKGVPEHEFMHALGFEHEHSRLDRDQHIIVNLNNVVRTPQDQSSNFKIYKPTDYDDFGLPYDTNSIMHYQSFLFSTAPDTPAITRLDGSIINFPDSFTETDFARLNTLYGCASGGTRPDDSQFDMTCSNSDLGADDGTPDFPDDGEILSG